LHGKIDVENAQKENLSNLIAFQNKVNNDLSQHNLIGHNIDDPSSIDIIHPVTNTNQFINNAVLTGGEIPLDIPPHPLNHPPPEYFFNPEGKFFN
jgi:hypothetical protein